MLSNILEGVLLDFRRRIAEAHCMFLNCGKIPGLTRLHFVTKPENVFSMLTSFFLAFTWHEARSSHRNNWVVPLFDRVPGVRVLRNLLFPYFVKPWCRKCLRSCWWTWTHWQTRMSDGRHERYNACLSSDDLGVTNAWGVGNGLVTHKIVWPCSIKLYGVVANFMLTLIF